MADTALVIGVGALEGIGARCALRYAAEGAQVMIAGRTQARLDAVQEEAGRLGHRMLTAVADSTDKEQVGALFDRAEKDSGTVTLLHYNTGNNMPGSLAGMEPEYFEQCWRLCAYGGFLCAKEAVRRLQEADRQGCILFTGASASMRGRAMFGAFNAAKAALRIMAQALAKEVAEDGIHVGHVVVDGAVDGDQIHSRYAEYGKQAAAEGRLISIEAIADAFCFLWKQKREGWSFEVDVRTHREPW